MSFLSSGGRAPPIRSAATSVRPFPTSFRCPTLTLVALAIRQAEYIVEQLKTGSIPPGARARDGRDLGGAVPEPEQVAAVAAEPGRGRERTDAGERFRQPGAPRSPVGGRRAARLRRRAAPIGALTHGPMRGRALGGPPAVPTVAGDHGTVTSGLRALATLMEDSPSCTPRSAAVRAHAAHSR